jgi:hypothetical protein
MSLTGDEVFWNCFSIAVFECPNIRVFQFGLEDFVLKFFWILQVLVIMNIFVNSHCIMVVQYLEEESAHCIVEIVADRNGVPAPFLDGFSKF